MLRLFLRSRCDFNIQAVNNQGRYVPLPWESPPRLHRYI